MAWDFENMTLVLRDGAARLLRMRVKSARQPRAPHAEEQREALRLEARGARHNPHPRASGEAAKTQGPEVSAKLSLGPGFDGCASAPGMWKELHKSPAPV